MSRLPALSALMLLAGCTSTDPRAGQDALASARARWASAGPADYAMTEARQWYCPTQPELRGPFRVTVRGGAVVGAILDGEAVPADRALSAEDLFEQVERASARRADRVDVTYHPTLGYPTSLQMDQDVREVHDDMGYTVRDVSAE